MTVLGMGLQDAASVFARYGVRAQGLDADALRQSWLRLARRYHTAGGCREDQAAMAEINAAYDALSRDRLQAMRQAKRRDPLRQGICVWAWAGHAGEGLPDDRIARENDSDRNFVKRRIWLLAGSTAEEWAIWPFDGWRFLPPLTVYGATRCFGAMGQAALAFGRQGFRSPQAVFVQRHGDLWGRLHLILLDGVQTDPLLFQHQGGANPAQDWVFVQNLPARLNALRRPVMGHDRRRPGG